MGWLGSLFFVSLRIKKLLLIFSLPPTLRFNLNVFWRKRNKLIFYAVNLWRFGDNNSYPRREYFESGLLYVHFFWSFQIETGGKKLNLSRVKFKKKWFNHKLNQDFFPPSLNRLIFTAEYFLEEGACIIFYFIFKHVSFFPFNFSKCIISLRVRENIFKILERRMWLYMG